MGDSVKELMEGAEEGAVWDGGGHRYQLEKVVGNGAFGIVWRARSEDGDVVAIKKVLLDRRYHNRELQMMKVMEHESIVRLRHYFEKVGRKKDETYLHLVMDYLPETLRSVALQHHKRRKRFQVDHIKAYLWQTFRALEYIHARRICHRDIKPDNVLCDPATLKCRLCDFGCSKVLVKGQPNVSYICSRYYRAPELMFGATEYAVGVDVWSVGTILMELLLGHLPFQGQDSTQQHLVEIMKLLGTPTERDLQAMRATCSADDLPKLKPFPWDRLFPPNTPSEATDLAQRLLRYDPDQRLTASQTLSHPFFDGSQQLVEGSGSAGASSESSSDRRSAPAPKSASADWEKKLNKYFDDLVGEGAGLAKLESSMLRKIEQSAKLDQVPAALARQVVGVVRDELNASFKQRDDSLRSVQKRLVQEAQQLQLSLPLDVAAGADDATRGSEGAGDVQKLERDLAQTQKASQQAMEAAEAEKEELQRRIRSVKEQLAVFEGQGASGAGSSAAAGGAVREAGSQTDEEPRTPTPGYGRRAVAAAPTRVASGVIDHHMAGASPLQQRSAEPGGKPLMVHTDNMGQVTPLASFSPGSAASNLGSSPLGMQRQSSAGRGRRGTRLSEEGPAAADGDAPSND